ncbi:MAG: response regulator [Candidatus Eisenbacteria bacterium]|nr:response regulator [Candidatus Eisenbacteria bacterium]
MHFRDAPLGQKLTAIITLTSATVLLLACGTFVVYDLETFRSRMISDMDSLAEIVEKNCQAPLMFGDPRAAEEVLVALAARKHLQGAALYAADGTRFASYDRPGGLPLPASGRGLAEGSTIQGHQLRLVHTVRLRGERLGTLCLLADTDEATERSNRYVLVGFVVLLVSIGCAFLVSRRAQRVVSGPIVELAEAARAVSADRNHSIRVEKHGQDEVGRLTDAFNEMVSQIQVRDRALCEAQEQLERRLGELQLEILDRERAEEALRHSQEQLLQSQKMEAIGKLAGGVAHDFNNLLTAIHGYGDLLLHRLPGDTPLRGYVEEILASSKRAAGLTRQLLAFSRRQILAPQVLDVNAVVTNMERMLRRLIGEHIELVAHLSESPGNVKADPGQLEQVVLNLVVNARDAMPDGGRLVVETGETVRQPDSMQPCTGEGPRRFVVISVSDSGVGMDRELQRRIFEPFFTTKEQGKGTGLGLSTVYGIVQQSGGHIEVESEPGRGSRFRVLLPRVDAVAEDPGAESASPFSASAPRGHETLLVVEDEESVRRLLTTALTAGGYRVLAAEDGEAGVELFRLHREEISLVLTDLVMPRMNGKEVLESVRALAPDVLVMFMSGYADASITGPGKLPPGSIILQKPFLPSDMLAAVRSALDGREVRNAA